MAINKQKNKSIQITFPKEWLDVLDRYQKELESKGIVCSRSRILLVAFVEHFTNHLNRVEESKKKGDKGNA